MKTLVCFISHIINADLINRFFDIKNAVEGKYDIIYVSPNVYIKDDNLNQYIVNLDIKENFFDQKNQNVTKNNLAMLEIYNRYPEYDNYWFIENDVAIFNDNICDGWKNIFRFYDNNKSDLICSKIHKYTEISGYTKRYPIENLQNYNIHIPYNELLFGFLTICRLSNKLLKQVKKYYDEYDGFFEYIIPSIAKKLGMQISSFTEDGFDIEDTSNHDDPNGINIGSNTWNETYLLSKLDSYPKNKNIIIHPIKLNKCN